MKNKIDTSQWRIFKVSDVFGNPTRPKARSIKQYELGDIPFVASGNFNNGIELYVEPKVDEQLDKGGCISISPVGGFAFFQETDFLGRGGAGSSILLLYHKNLNRFNALFLCSILSKSCEKYGYGDMCSAEKLKSELLLLPADSLGQPDWAYMENYIKQVIAKQNKHLELLLLSTPPNCEKQLKTKEWSEFLFSDLFSIKKGKRLTKANMRDGDIRFIGASAINNGVTAHIANTTHLHPANTISVNYNGSVGEAFYQDKSFWASDDVNVLHLKTHHLSKEIALFLIPLIRKVGKRFKFDEKWTKDLMNRTKLKLPVDTSGAPDWSYMEAYIYTALSAMNNNQKLLQAASRDR